MTLDQLITALQSLAAAGKGSAPVRIAVSDWNEAKWSDATHVAAMTPVDGDEEYVWIADEVIQ